MVEGIPMKRAGKPEDVAGLVASSPLTMRVISPVKPSTSTAPDYVVMPLRATKRDIKMIAKILLNTCLISTIASPLSLAQERYRTNDRSGFSQRRLTSGVFDLREDGGLKETVNNIEALGDKPCITRAMFGN